MLLRYWLGTGSMFVVFDGLDEVLSVSNRISVAHEIQEIIDRNPLSRFVVTSRFVGYDVAPLQSVEHVGIGPIDAEMQDELFRRIYVNILEKDDKKINEELASFKYEAEKRAPDLMNNPLLFTLIVIVHDRKKEIPDNRAMLYGQCAELLFERWDKYREIDPNLPERFRLNELLMHLATLLLNDVEYGGRISKDDLIATAKNFFISDYLDNRAGRAARAASLFVDHLTGRSWILHEIGEGVFEFTHRTFLEYFYAKNLDALEESAEELLRGSVKRLEDSSKVIASHIALQMKCKDKRRVATKAASVMIELLDGNRDAALRGFAVEMLGYLLADVATMQKLCEVLAVDCISDGDAPSLLRILSINSPLSNDISQVTCSAVWRKIRSMKQLRLLAPVVELLSDREPSSIEARERSNCIRVFERKQGVSHLACKTVVLMGGSPDWAAIERHGIKLWSINGVSGARGDGRISLLQKIALRLADEKVDMDDPLIKLATITYGVGINGELRRSNVEIMDTADVAWSSADEYLTYERCVLALRTMMFAWEVMGERVYYYPYIELARCISMLSARIENEVQIDEAYSNWGGGQLSYFRGRSGELDRSATIEHFASASWEGGVDEEDLEEVSLDDDIPF